MTLADSTKRRAILAGGAILVAGAVNILPWRLVAQENRPEPAPSPSVRRVPARNAAELRQRFQQLRARYGSPTAPGRAFGGGSGMMEGGAPRFGAAAAMPPAAMAPARFEATVYQVQVPENRVLDLDAQVLEGRAKTAQELAKALTDFGKTKVLYQVDQRVNLYGENITLGASKPMVTNTRMDSRGNTINSISYQQVGLTIRISANPPSPEAKRKAPDTQVNFHLSALADSGVELAHNVTASVIHNVTASVIRNVELNHSETPRFGKPSVLLNVSTEGGGAATLPTAYVFRYVFNETKP